MHSTQLGPFHPFLCVFGASTSYQPGCQGSSSPTPPREYAHKLGSTTEALGILTANLGSLPGGGLGFSSAASEQAERRQQPQQLGRPWAMRRLPSREGNSSFKGGQRGRQQQAAALTLLEASTALKPAGSPGLRFNSACREDEQTAEPSKFAALEAPLEGGREEGRSRRLSCRPSPAPLLPWVVLPES